MFRLRMTTTQPLTGLLRLFFFFVALTLEESLPLNYTPDGEELRARYK